MSLEEVRQICVTNFPLSKRREMIMAGLELLLTELQAQGIVADVWIDGSFLTEKQEPDDVDLVLSLASDIYDNGTSQQKQTLDAIGNQLVDLKPNYHCHTFVYYEYPVGSPFYEVGVRAREYWKRQFGFSRHKEVKGMPVVKIPIGTI